MHTFAHARAPKLPRTHPQHTQSPRDLTFQNLPQVQSISVGTTEYEHGREIRPANQPGIHEGRDAGISLLFASGDRASQPYKGKYWVCILLLI